MNLNKFLNPQPINEFSAFLNAAFIGGRYAKENIETSIAGKKVKLVPDLNINTRFNYNWKSFFIALQFLDLSAKYKYKFAQLEAGINNLTNNFYFTRRAVGYPGPGIIPSPGRNFYVTLDLKF